MMGFEYTLYDNTFTLNWDIVDLISAFQRRGRCIIVGPGLLPGALFCANAGDRARVDA